MRRQFKLALNNHLSNDTLNISRSHISTRINKTGSWRYVRPVYENRAAPCSAACPVGADIPQIEMHVSRGKFKEALTVLLNENPFPAVSGHVCFHACEDVCNRSYFDDAVAINAIERFLGRLALNGNLRTEIPVNPTTGRRVGIVGSGPSGLSAAYFLSRLGYECDIYEAQTKPGGLLRWGIPTFRLPEAVLNTEIERIRRLGVRIHCRHKVSADFLQSAGDTYDALFMGCGHSRSIPMNIEGEAAAIDGLDFLNEVRQALKRSIKETSIVIGGGNTAIDVARSLVRLGSDPMILYRRRVEDMPAFADEIRMALEEGITIRELTIPVHMEKVDDAIVLSLEKMKVASIDPHSKRARVVPLGGKRQDIRAQQVFTAIGADISEPWYLPPDNRQVLKMSHCSLMKDDIPIAFGGDLVNRTRSVADAIASGKQAAVAIDTYFKHGAESIDRRMQACRIGNGPGISMEAYLSNQPRFRQADCVVYDDINIDYFEQSTRVEPTVVSPAMRVESFSEYREHFTDTQAIQEASRCFNCGTCNACDNCSLFCPESAVLVDNSRRIDLDYCKGCGVCVQECPRNAMTLEGQDHDAGS